MSELIEKLRSNFQDKEYRHSYAEECLNSTIATQIKVLREQRDMTQGELAEATGMKQPRIPLLEDANYSNWTVNTLKRFAKAFDVALSVRFETFSQVIYDFENLSRQSLQVPAFANDIRFQRRSAGSRMPDRHRRRTLPRMRRARNWELSHIAKVQVSGMGLRKPSKSVEAAGGANARQDAGQLSATLYLEAAAGGSR